MNTEDLMMEARAAKPIAWKQRVAWLKQKLRSDPSQVEALSKAVRRMGWTSINVKGLAEHVAKQKEKGKGLAAKLNAIANTPMMTMAELKARFPIKDYCERILKLTFSADNQTKCPLHNGTSLTTFVVEPAKRIFTCFGHCPPKDDREYFTGDVIDLHQRAFNLPTLSAAKRSLEKLANGDAALLNPVPVLSSFLSPKTTKVRLATPKAKTTKVDTELVSKVLAEDLGEAVVSSKGATAFDFAKLLLERILRRGDMPIVFVNQKWPIIGVAARAMLCEKPDELQYICSCTAKTAFRNALWPDDGTNRKQNLKERIFLDVEFDDMPLGDQLKILWWLKRVRKWKLISITFSGSKSYHGLFYIRGQTKEQVQSMESLAKRLGACSGSLRPHQPVRFPGGLRREPQPKRQEIIYLDKLTAC